MNKMTETWNENIIHTTTRIKSDNYLYFLPQYWLFKIRLDYYFHFHPGPSNFPHQGNDSEWQADVFSGAVPNGGISQK